MATAAFTVLVPMSLPGLVRFALSTPSDSPTTLIVCSGREAFLQALAPDLQLHHMDDDSGAPGSLRQLTTPTLHNLFTARHVKVAFCPSVHALQAYLAAANQGEAGISGTTGKQCLLLVNPLALHALTPSFSAQGLSRTFAVAVETASRLGASLHLVECTGMRMHSPMYVDQDDDDMGGGEEEREEAARDPWEQEVPILNLSTIRRYGSGSGDRVWAGRTVKVKRIAARWFRFQSMEEAPED
ncbi:hypothetical protein EJ04DRAFT_541025 [Polyplosphaeria fusca]|uniref:Uncharacterized protein n=1 Tax=Polyplosphaeria fusca TaxID=682080 RepID=A0A9P4R468_9PLEO|nr:hypothetical protein EJ04DRAFT_541025 [Polyplosphaeria fusca]